MNKNIQLLVIIYLISCFLSNISVPIVKATENSWATKEQMLTARYKFGIATVNGKIYAIGGLASDPLDTNEEYDPVTDAWTTKTPMPTSRYNFGIAVYDNKIYTFGGLIERPLQKNTYVGVTEVYDPATNSWETKTSMPTNRSALCANVINSKIYLTGGIIYGPPPSFSSISEVTEVYDPKTDTWTTKKSIPNPVCSYASAVVNSKIHIMGGSNQSAVYTTFNQVYDPKTDTWSHGTPLPTGVRFASAGATSGVMAQKRIYVLGGSVAQFPDGSNLTQIYDPEKDVWSSGSPMPTPRSGLNVAVINDVLYAIGGFNTNGENVLAVNEQYTPVGYIPEFPLWTILPLILSVTLLVLLFKKRLITTSVS